MTELRSELSRLYRRWKAGQITREQFNQRRAALKKRHAAVLRRNASRKRKK